MSWVILGLVGLAWGSFSAAIAQRARVGEQWLYGRSRCDDCGHSLSTVELVPLVSYCTLLGRCRHCRAIIPLIHPTAEAMGGALALLCVVLFPEPVRYWALGGALIWLTISLIDLRVLRIPDVWVVILGLLGVGYSLLCGYDLAARALGAAMAASVLVGAGLIYERRRGRIGIGRGDIKLVAASSLWLGPSYLPWAILLASASGLIWIAVARRGEARDARMAFAPFLAIGYFAILVVQSGIEGGG